MSRAGFIARLRGVLTIKDTPHRIAIAVALGVFIGISPLLGAHTLLGLAVAWVFRLNRLTVLTGVYVTNPWSVVPIYTFSIWVGMVILGTDRVLPDIDWESASMFSVLNDMRYILMPFVVGTIAVGFVSAVLIYVIVRKAAERV